MSGFENDVVVGANLNFNNTGPKPHLGIITQNGQLLIGATTAPFIRGGLLTSLGNTVTITNGPGTINLEANAPNIPYYSLTPYIVGADEHSQFTTIGAAYAAAVAAGAPANVIVKPGTYTEDITLSPNINIVSLTGSDDTGLVNIIGELSYSGAGAVTISNIRLQTNGNFLLSVTGSSASSVTLNSCTLACSNNTGVSFTSSSSSAKIFLDNCNGDIQTTGISLFSSSSPGLLFMTICNITNSGNSTTASTLSAGLFGSNFCTLGFPVTTSGTGSVSSVFNNYENASNNATCLTIGGSGGGAFRGDSYTSGTATALIVNSTSVFVQAEVDSSNINAIAGSGTVSLGIITFTGTSSTIDGTLAVNKLITYGGTIV